MSAAKAIRDLVVAMIVAGTLVGFVAVVCGQTPTPADNPFNAEVAALGRMLFFDPRLGADNTIACATCHVPERGWTDNRNVSLGIRNQPGTRNAPTILNAGRQTFQFWDGKGLLLEGQAPNPLENPVEHGNRKAEDVAAKLNRTGYRQLFRQVFGGDVTVARLSAALATFQRTIIVDDSPFDRYRRGETWALTAAQKRGLAVFETVGCSSCHSGEDLRNGDFANTGVSFRAGGRDQGRFGVTQREVDRRKFKVPTLRNLRDTGPYFHNGSATNLEEVLAHYQRGGANDRNQIDRLTDPRVLAIRGRLSLQNQADLIEFLRDGLAGTVPIVTAPRLP